MNPATVAILAVGVIVVLAVAVALLVDYGRALDLEREENRAHRSRDQVARLLVAELVRRPSPDLIAVADQWLRDEQHDPQRIVREARRRQGEHGRWS